MAQNDDEVTTRTGSVAVDDMTFRHTVEKPGIKPGSMTVTYVSSGANKTLTDQANGLLTADGNGAIHYAPGELSFKLDYLPDSGTEIQLTYEQGNSAGGEEIVSVDGQVASFPERHYCPVQFSYSSWLSSFQTPAFLTPAFWISRGAESQCLCQSGQFGKRPGHSIKVFMDPF